MKKGIVAAAALFAASSAHAQERFGAKGQVVPSGSAGFSYSSISVTGASASVVGLQMSPGVLFFVRDGIALGGKLAFVYQHVSAGGTSDSASSFGIGPVAGVNAPLGERVSWFPQLGITFLTRDLFVAANAPRLNTLALEMFAPFLFHPVRHFFLGGGPSFSADVVAGINTPGEAPKTVAVGVQSVIGGWF
jgi:hypothetical protein